MPFFAGAVITLAFLCSVGFAQSFSQRIDSLQLTDGHLPGAYIQNRNAAGLIWYFSTIGVHSIALDGERDQNVRDYLDRYLATATLPGGAINDVNNVRANTIQWKLSDSDDSYAAGILSLACWYSHREDGERWFKENLDQLKYIARFNLVDTIDPSLQLTSTFNKLPSRFTEDLITGKWQDHYQDDLVKKENFRHVCQLMDNCEGYRGLRDFANRLTEMNDPDARPFIVAYQTLSEGIQRMFDTTTNSFRASTVASDTVSFYPNRFIQIAPEVYEVDLGPNTKAIYEHAWRFLNAGGDKWWEGQISDGSNKGDPMMILAYAAICHGDARKAASHLEYFQKMLMQPSTSDEFANIAELGWAHRSARKLR